MPNCKGKKGRGLIDRTAVKWHDPNKDAKFEPETEREEDWYYCDFCSVKRPGVKLKLSGEHENATLKKIPTSSTEWWLLESDYEQDGDEDLVTYASEYPNPYVSPKEKMQSAKDLIENLSVCPVTARRRKIQPFEKLISKPEKKKELTLNRCIKKNRSVYRKKMQEEAQYIYELLCR